MSRLTSLALLATLLSACGLSNDVSRLKGWDALRAGEGAKAQTHFEKCAQSDPTDWKSHYYLGRIGLDYLNDPYYARRHLEICETIRKSLPDTQLTPVPGAANTAVPYPTRQQIADALAESMLRQGLRDRLSNYVKQQATEYGEADDYMRVGRYLHAIGDNDGAAIGYVEATMVAAPSDARPHIALAEFYDKVGDRPAALTELRKAYYIDPAIKDLADNIRRHGMVPGPTIAIAPERKKPTIVRPGADRPVPAAYPAPGQAATSTAPPKKE